MAIDIGLAAREIGEEIIRSPQGTTQSSGHYRGYGNEE